MAKIVSIHRRAKLIPTDVPAGQQGFALVVALGLMAFLLLMIAAIATLSVVETARIDTELLQFQVRQNAMLGLRLAIAQLQETAGPDRRVTARADILAPTESLPESAGGDIPAVQPATSRMYWTGVFNPDAPTRAQMRSNVSWLVSGKRQGLSDIAANENDGMFTIFSAGFEPDERIQVPLVSIPRDDSGAESGQFAYFIADEGIKAKINLSNTSTQNNPIVSAQRFGTENLRLGGDAYSASELQQSAKESLATLNDPSAPSDATARLRRLNQLNDIRLLLDISDESTGTISELRELLNRASLDVTTHSFGLLTDMRNGGLKTDLTTLFNNPPAAELNKLIFPEDRSQFGATMSAVSAINRRHLRGPSWRYLYNFATLSEQLVQGTEATPVLAPHPGGDPKVELSYERPDYYTERPPIAPILLSAGLRFGLECKMVPGPSEEVPGGNRIYITISPIVVLWNPYDVTLAAEDYIVEFDRYGSGLWRSPVLSLALIDATDPWWQKHESLFRFIDESWVPSEAREHGVDKTISPFSVHINFVEFSPDFDPDLLKSNQQGTGEDFRSHNLYFALQDVILEPGEIAWFTLEDSEISLADPESRILTRGEHDGYIAVPFHSEMGYVQYGTTHTYLFHKDYDEDFGFVTDEDYFIGSARLSFQVEQISVALRMRAPDNAQPLISELSTPSGNRAFRDQTKWPIIQYISCNRTSQPRISDLVPLTELLPDDDLLQVHIRFSAPFQDITEWPFSPSQAPSNTGVKLLANHSLRCRMQTSLFFDDIGVTRYTSPLYRIDYDVDPLTEYFEPTELWEKFEYRQAAVMDDMDMENPSYGVVLFHVPRLPLQSIGEFQHLDFSMSSWDPSYVVGNSLASPWLDPDDIEGPVFTSHTRRDRSYILNELLWDSYFFSTWDPASDTDPTNGRMLPIGLPEDYPETFASEDVAAYLAIDGPFNINSTSVEAWKALLSSLNLLNLKYQPKPVADPETKLVSNAFSRSPLPLGGTAAQHDASGFFSDDAAYWRGFRELSEQQIDDLAQEIVRQVRERGPFRSLADFINRRPGEPDGTFDIDHSLMGALQAAIELQSDHSSNPINPRDPSMWVYTGGEGGIVNNSKYLYPEAAAGPRRQGAPGYLMQADLLTPLGPILTARSDTFKIRVYGSVADPLTGDIRADAVCEAVVQRMPEFVDSNDSPTLAEADLSPINQQFGRRFTILSLRWLDPDEI